MTAIIKTWPSFMPQKRVLEAFNNEWGGQLYFTLGRGKPKQKIDQIYFTHCSRILGHFDIVKIVRNEGQLPKLRRISGEESEWQIKPDSYVAICEPPFHLLEERLYYSGFRGYRYFSIEEYRNSLDAKVRL